MNIQEQINAVSIPQSEVTSETDPRFAGGQHVSLVFDDGEHTSTKAGPLYGLRNFHCLVSGHPTKTLDKSWFPYEMGGHGFVFCTYEQAKELSMNIHQQLAEGQV